MDILTENQQHAIAERIVRDFGDGVLKGEVYLFDQIIGALGCRVRLSDVLPKIADEKDVVVLLDRHPNNHQFAQQLMRHLGVSDAWGVTVPTEQLQGILRFIDCDLYVTTLHGRLLLVACHEDVWVDDDRTVWSPLKRLAARAIWCNRRGESR
jgi:hypothetical protein